MAQYNGTSSIGGHRAARLAGGGRSSLPGATDELTARMPTANCAAISRAQLGLLKPLKPFAALGAVTILPATHSNRLSLLGSVLIRRSTGVREEAQDERIDSPLPRLRERH